jgi:tRNA (cytidine56-2'-O)-methyltransferase
MIIEVARLGQRLVRDDRVTTHAALVSRAFGARRIYMNETNPDIRDTLRGVGRTWGGDFKVALEEDLKGIIRRRKAESFGIVHLTMYGEALDVALPRMTHLEKILVVIGAGKVPREIYDMADYNVAVGSQPHSEIAALAVFLDRVQDGRQFGVMPSGAARRIIPSRRGKRVVDGTSRGAS